MNQFKVNTERKHIEKGQFSFLFLNLKTVENDLMDGSAKFYKMTNMEWFRILKRRFLDVDVHLNSKRSEFPNTQ